MLSQNFKISVFISLCFVISNAFGQAASFPLDRDKAGSITFDGSETARLYTKILESSFTDVFKENYISTTTGAYTPGYVRASIVPKVCHDQMWTRDVGTFIREMVAFGTLNHACQTTAWLMEMVDKNDDGYYTYPENFYAGERKAGKELDGTAAIVMGMIDLYRALPINDPFRKRIYTFLSSPASPLKYMLFTLSKSPLVAGSGEFGGGAGIHKVLYNVVQNHMVALALTAGKKMEMMEGNAPVAEIYGNAAALILQNIDKYFVGKDQAWVWTVDPANMQSDSAINNSTINKGFGGINGVLSMYSDVKGLQPLKDQWKGIQYSQNTFNKLYNTPLRKRHFEQYGMWTQFDVYNEGVLGSPSYGIGYAMQVMLLSDKLSMLDKLIKWFSNETYQPLKEYTDLKRKSPYHIYERYYSPEAVGKIKLEEGCGELNLVNVTEQLKVGRLILGLDNTNDQDIIFIPRMPPSFTSMKASNWPIYTNKGMSRVDISCSNNQGKYTFSLKVISGPTLEKLSVLLPGNQSYVIKKNVKEMVVIK